MKVSTRIVSRAAILVALGLLVAFPAALPTIATAAYDSHVTISSSTPATVASAGVVIP